jgi:alkanesulfonate monooxygenase SsuD/methylene tetrahydromethanopterin reductase-like flavin-dependent oxidoreductase (luciferase family)
MRLSLWPFAHQPWSDVLDAASHADATGWDGVYIADHFMGDGGAFGPATTPMLEATATIAALAAATERVRVGSLVLGNTYRHPAVVANWAATVDRLSGGRLVLGVGAGWQRNEHEQYGIDLPPVKELIDRFDEACQVLTGLLRQPTTSLEGRHYRLREAISEPKPVQQPLPLLIGGKGDRMLGIVARLADEWNMWGLAPVIAERAAVLDRRCEAIGRDPATVARSAQALVLVTADEAKARRFVEQVAPRAAVAGPPERFAEAVEAWQEAGVSEVIVPDVALGTGTERRDTMDALREVVN